MQGGSLRRHFSIMQKSTFMLGQELAKIALMFILVHFQRDYKKTTNFAFPHKNYVTISLKITYMKRNLARLRRS
jgi:hypothetical protein